MELISRSVGRLILEVVVSCSVFEMVDESQVVVEEGDVDCCAFGTSTAESGVVMLTDTFSSHAARLSWLTGHTCGGGACASCVGVGDETKSFCARSFAVVSLLDPPPVSLESHDCLVEWSTGHLGCSLLSDILLL